MANSAVGGLVGPLLGGLLIGVLDIGWILAINAATFAWSWCFIWLTRLPGHDSLAEPDDKPGSSTRAVLREVLHDRDLRGARGPRCGAQHGGCPVPVLILALAVNHFDVGPSAFGVLQMMISAGIIMGSLAASRLARGAIGLPTIVLGVCLGIVGLLPYAASSVALLAAGIAIAVANTIVITIFRKTRCPTKPRVEFLARLAP